MLKVSRGEAVVETSASREHDLNPRYNFWSLMSAGTEGTRSSLLMAPASQVSL